MSESSGKIELVRKAILSRRTGDCEWVDDKTALRVGSDQSNQGLTPVAIKLLLQEWIAQGGDLRCTAEHRENWRDKRDFYYWTVMEVPGFRRGLFVDMELTDDDVDDPIVYLLNAHPRRFRKPEPVIRPYPWKCAKCRERAVEPATVDYVAEMEHDGRAHSVSVQGLSILKCNQCGNQLLSDEAYERLTEALRYQLGLLPPGLIRQNRERLALTQQQLAAFLGVAEATLSRWETGAQIQQLSLDRLLRVFFAFPQVQAALASEDQVPKLGLVAFTALPTIACSSLPPAGSVGDVSL